MENHTINLEHAIEHCRESCIDFITENLSAEDSYVLKCVEFCKDCEKICETAAAYISRRSFYSKKILKLCSEICHKCADELSRHTLPEGKKCAGVCRYCAQECAAAS